MPTDKAEPFGGAGVDERGRTVAFPTRLPTRRLKKIRIIDLPLSAGVTANNESNTKRSTFGV